MSPRCRTSLPLLCSLALVTLVAPGAQARSTARPAARDSGQDLDAVLRRVPDPAHGREVFRVCTVCHGAHEAGLPRGWVPEIAGQHVRVIAKQLVDFRHGRRWDLRMEIVASRHVLKSSKDIADVASYAASLRPLPPNAVGAGEDVRRGQELYGMRCVACHGRGGEGRNTRFVPRLAGQDYDYLLRQLHDAIDGRRPGLSATHAKLLKRLDAADLEGLADYLSRLHAQGGTS